MAPPTKSPGRRIGQGTITDKDARKVANQAVAAGWTFRVTRSCHVMLLSPDGAHIVTVSGSASRQGAAHHLRRDLRAAGFTPR